MRHPPPPSAPSLTRWLNCNKQTLITFSRVSQGWVHPGLVEVSGPCVLITRTKLNALQQAQPLHVHEGVVLKDGGLEKLCSGGSYMRQELTGGDGSEGTEAG